LPAISSPGLQDGLKIGFFDKLCSYQQFYLGGEIRVLAAFFEPYTGVLGVPFAGPITVQRLMECEHLARYLKESEQDRIAPKNVQDPWSASILLAIFWSEQDGIAHGVRASCSLFERKRARCSHSLKCPGITLGTALRTGEITTEVVTTNGGNDD
jgi:hypothetical protein